jgi:acid stress-induced BolA-like protein IbaG/YrbA
MISNEQLEQELKNNADVDWVQVTGDGYHYHITLVSDVFEGQSKVARQQWVYARLNEYITSGRVHAVNIKTWTNDEWERQHG